MNSPFNLSRPIAIGSDHAGFDYKEDLISFLEGKGLTSIDFGTHSRDSVDYADFAHPVARAVEKGEADLESSFAEVPTVWPLQLINTREYVQRFAGVKNWRSFPANIIMPTLFVCRLVLSGREMRKKW